MSTSEFHCARCRGLVGEQGKAYGYAGQWCYCSEPLKAKDDTLSNGVALGVWANPALGKLSDLKLPEMILKSDHDLEVKKLKLEIEMLREQRNKQAYKAHSAYAESFIDKMIKEQLDAEITTALSKLDKGG